MDDALQVVVEMHESLWGQVKSALEDLNDEEIHWRPLPQANTISVIIRHLRIEAEWHLDSLERGEPMPTIAVTAPPEVIDAIEAIDAVPADFEENFKRLEELYTRFVELLRTATLETLQQRTAATYGQARRLTYSLGYHQATHLAMHCGQIRSIRNWYRKTRGEPARFFPDNPTYPKDYGREKLVPTREGSPIFYHRPHGRPCHGITHEVIEDFNRLCRTIIENPERARFSMPENLSLITCTNYNRKVLIEKCLEAYGIDGLVVLGQDIVQWDWSCKIRPVLAYLESGIPAGDYIVAVDSDDVLMVNSPANIIDFFETYSCDVLFCNTFVNWPFNKEYGEFEALTYYTHQLHSHLSAGGYVGRRGPLIEFLREILSAFEGKQEWAMEGGVFDDQLGWRHLHYKYYPRIKVDFRSLIFKRYDLFIDYD